MSILTATGLSKHFGAQDIFEDVSLQIAHGERTALVGPNGAGKTTLLQILAGLETESSGQIHCAKGLRIGYLPQEATLVSSGETLWELGQSAFAHLQLQAAELRRLEGAMAAALDPAERDQLLARYGQAQDAFELAGGYTYEHRMRQVLSGLGFAEEDYQRPLTQFSGGQQTRARLANLLLDAPDLLLLDEPTNHLDLDAVEWLENYLQAWNGAIVVTAHDRYFLDKVASKVWDLSHGQLQVYRGNYTAYLQQRTARRERQEREFRRQQAFVAKEVDFIRRNIAGQRTKEAQGRRKRLEQLDQVERVREEKRLNLDLLQTDLRSGDLVLATYDLYVGYEPSAPLFICPDLEIRRGDRVALIGPNGAGKTTFVKTILKEVKPLAGRVRLGSAVEIGYLAQAHAGLNLNQSVLDEVLSASRGTHAGQDLLVGQARNILGRFLFSGDDVFKPVGALSGGERARVALAKLALRGANFLVLDEPTNHLDIPSQEILQAVLGDFPGTILLVSHDRYFIDALATQVWALEDETLHLSKAEAPISAYNAYLADRQARQLADSAEADTRSEERAADRASRRDRPKREQVRNQRALAELEAAIESAESRLAELSAALEAASHAQAVEQLHSLGRDYRATEEDLARLLDRWTAMETI
ncbi:MAG: ABC-F family ATP-binding cassette domain-containing protein [Anaerolineales bacterium]|nr:MAG: ABC-F family ATP-binding cassette domain-containing protein [Anaerolineales bacterium]